MTSYEAITLKTFRETVSKMGTVLVTINPREEVKPGGKHGELDIRTDGFDEVLTSGEKCVAYEVMQTLRLYGLWPGGKA